MTPSLPKILLAVALWGGLYAHSLGQEIGLELSSLRDQFSQDFPGTMAKIRQMGIKEVGISGTYGQAFPDFIKQLALNELTVVTYGADFEKLRDFPQNVADEARAYGAKYVVCNWIPHSNSTFTAADVDASAEALNNAAQIMARNGLLLCYHPHGYEFGPHENGTVFDYMIKKFDSRFVQFEMDAFWIKQAGQDPLTLLKKYHSRWVLMHLKDRKRGSSISKDGYADVETNVVLGDGDVGIAEIMKEAKKFGIQYFFIEDESSKAEKQIPKSISYLKNLEE